MSDFEKETISEIQKLIRLKRYECPPEGAVDDFIEEFQRRQRSQSLTGSSRKLFLERLSTYMAGFGKQRWVVAAGAAYACVMLFFLIRPSAMQMQTGAPGSGGSSAVPVNMKGSVIQKPAARKGLIEEPAYDPRINRVRPQPTEKKPDVNVF